MISVCACSMCVAPEGAGSAPQASAPLKRKKERDSAYARESETTEERGSLFRQQWQAVFHLQPTDRQTDRRTRTGMPPICLLLIHLLSSGCHREPQRKCTSGLLFCIFLSLFLHIFLSYFCPLFIFRSLCFELFFHHHVLSFLHKQPYY